MLAPVRLQKDVRNDSEPRNFLSVTPISQLPPHDSYAWIVLKRLPLQIQRLVVNIRSSPLPSPPARSHEPLPLSTAQSHESLS